MSKTQYFVTLKPLQPYFFGGEHGIYPDYYLKGRFWPQQTSLLGLVRHQILIQNGLMANGSIKNEAEASLFIGKQSFDYQNSAISFGKIEQLSPCYLVSDKADVTKKFLPDRPAYLGQLQQVGDQLLCPQYDPKQFYPDRWNSLDFKDPIDNAANEIYMELHRVGINKNYEGHTETNAYYKQIWLRMLDGFGYGFYVTLDDDVILASNKVTFGKENVVFDMKVMTVNSEATYEPEEKACNALLLISDAYIGGSKAPEMQAIFSLADYAVTDTVPFWNITHQTSSDASIYYKLNKSKRVQNRLQMIKRGSVFISKDASRLEKMEQAFKSEPHFRKIGYNQFYPIHIPINQ